LNTLQNRFRWRRTACRCVVVVVLALILTSCGRRINDPEFVTRIPGTENIAAATGSMYVSPDERWVVFFTADRISSFVDGLVSYELSSGRRVEHNLDEIPSDVRRAMGERPYLGVLAYKGGHSGWRNNRLFLPTLMKGRYSALIVDNEDPSISIGSLPRGPMLLSDGPDWETWLEVLNNRLGPRQHIDDLTQTRLYSSAWKSEQYAVTTYWWARKSNTILSGSPNQDADQVATISSGSLFDEADFVNLRVSPDESYLSYVIRHRPRFFVSPAIRDAVHVIDLASGKDRVVCRFRLAGNLQWSPDSKRLYLTGNNPDDTRGVYVIDVAKAFK